MSHQSIYFKVENLDGKQDLKKIKRGLDTLHGVTLVSVDTASHGVSVDYDSTGVQSGDVEDCLHGMGYQFTRLAVDRRER